MWGFLCLPDAGIYGNAGLKDQVNGISKPTDTASLGHIKFSFISFSAWQCSGCNRILPSSVVIQIMWHYLEKVLARQACIFTHYRPDHGNTFTKQFVRAATRSWNGRSSRMQKKNLEFWPNAWDALKMIHKKYCNFYVASMIWEQCTKNISKLWHQMNGEEAFHSSSNRISNEIRYGIFKLDRLHFKLMYSIVVGRGNYQQTAAWTDKITHRHKANSRNDGLQFKRGHCYADWCR